jgi:hypothetical protein
MKFIRKDSKYKIIVGFEVLTAVNVKRIIVNGVTSCSVIEV